MFLAKNIEKTGKICYNVYWIDWNVARGIMASLNVSDVIKELDISKSYLYKLIDKENILIPRSETGRYFWDENTVKTIKDFCI